MELFSKITDLDILAEAWEKVARNKGAAGVNRITIEDYAERIYDNLCRLQRRLIRGQYHCGKLRVLKIPKKSGGTRTLAIPNIEDRIVQTAIALTLTPILEKEMEDSSFAYRPGRSVDQAVQRIAMYHRAGYNWVVEGDIVRYFDNIPHMLLRQRLKRSIEDKKVLSLIDDWLAQASDTEKGVPQGSPLSPLCANIFFDDMDEAIAQKKVKLVRFADDFVVLCKSKKKAEQLLKELCDLLADHGLELHPEKSRIVPFDRGFDFLGRLFVRSLVLKRKDPVTNLPEQTSETNFPETENDQYFSIHTRTSASQKGQVKVLYLTGKDRRVERQHNSFRIYSSNIGNEEQELLAISAHQVDRIECHSESTIEHSALELAMEHNIAVSFIDGQEREKGCIQPGLSNRSKRQLLQAEHTIDPEKRATLARAFVRGRLLNERGLLKRLNRSKKIDEVNRQARLIGRLPKKLDLLNSPSQIMAVEADGAKKYWPCLGNMLKEGWTFNDRNRHHSPKPFDILLNMTAWQLCRDVEVLLSRSGLHPGFSFLHSTQDYRDSLALDVIEEFRAPLCEGLAVYLVNNRIITPEMFTKAPGQGWMILPFGRDRVFKTYQSWVARDIRLPEGHTTTTWRGLIEYQIGKLVKHIEGNEVYTPYIMDY